MRKLSRAYQANGEQNFIVILFYPDTLKDSHSIIILSMLARPNLVTAGDLGQKKFLTPVIEHENNSHRFSRQRVRMKGNGIGCI